MNIHAKDWVEKTLKIIYYAISVAPLAYWILLSIFLSVYYIACPCDCHDCFRSNLFLNETRFLLIISVFFVFLSVLVWFPLYLHLMFDVKKRFAYVYLISHALLVISIFVDLPLNFISRIIL